MPEQPATSNNGSRGAIQINRTRHGVDYPSVSFREEASPLRHLGEMARIHRT